MMENASVHHEPLSGGLSAILEEEGVRADRVFSREQHEDLYSAYGRERDRDRDRDRETVAVATTVNPMQRNKLREKERERQREIEIEREREIERQRQREKEKEAEEEKVKENDPYYGDYIESQALPQSEQEADLVEARESKRKEGEAVEAEQEEEGWQTEAEDSREKKSYFNIAFLYVFYNIAFTMTIPALPALMLRLNNDNASQSAYYYGLAVFVRYIIEFFLAPMLGSMEDLYGRKIMLFLSFIVCALEFIFLSFFPSVAMIFITRAMAGSLDSALPTSYTIVTDIAVYNRDNVTRKFGLLGAMSGIGYILGPVVGGYLCSISIELCFLVAAGCTICGAVLTVFLLEETVHLNDHASTSKLLTEKSKCRCVRFQDFNPIPALLLHFSNKDLRELTAPLAISSLTLGIGFIWYIFMDYEYNASSTEIGVYLAFYGVVNAFIQGVLIKRLIPKHISEMRAAVYGLILLGIQVAGYGLSYKQWMLYLMVFLFTIGNISDPALKALIVKESLRQPNGALYQGNLQGVLCSIRTLGSAFGSLIFTSLFAYCVEQHPPMPYVPFVFAGVLYCVAALYLTLVFQNSAMWNEEEVKNNPDENQLKQQLLAN